MDLRTLADSSTAWFLAFVVVAGLLAVAWGSLVEGAIVAFLVVGLVFFAVSVFGR